MRLGGNQTEDRRLQYERRRTARAAAAAAYSVRIMASLAGALLLVLGIIHLPLQETSRLVSWEVISGRERLPVDMLEHPVRQPAAGAEVPITAFGDRVATPADDEEIAADGEIPVQVQQSSRDPRSKRMSVRVLEFADTMPQMEGGINSFYLNIEYPPEAQAAGIEGRLVLSFVVETDGQLSEVEVVSSLHPLCDSAAVRALRDVRFVPGMQNGEATRVRMRLPVRFELLSSDNSSAHPQRTGDLRRSQRPHRQPSPA